MALSSKNASASLRASSRPQVRAAKPATLRTSLVRRRVMVIPEAVGIFYSTSSGNTERIAAMIKEKMGDAAEAPQDIAEVSDLERLKQYDGLVVGAPTWNTNADEERSGTAWYNKLGSIKKLDLGGKPVACFGVGDSANYGDYYCDALEELHSIFSAAKGKMVGKWSYSEGEYEHSYSKAELEPGVFCGLALDQDNQDDLTPARIEKWVAQIKGEMGL